MYKGAIKLNCSETSSHCSNMAAMKNFTGDAIRKSYEELHCSAELTRGVHNQLIILSVLNIFLSITAFLGNTLILVALHKDRSLHPPSKLLFCSLAITDLCVGIIVEPIRVTFWMSMVNERWNICRFTFPVVFITGCIFGIVSLLTLSAIGVDRLLALLLGLRYRQVVTLKRTYVAVIAFWVFSFLGSIAYLWNELISLWYIYTIALLCLVTSIYCYTRIFLRLRHHQSQVQDNVQGQPNQTIPQNIARYRKTVFTALWLQLTLVLCYLPATLVGPLVIQGAARGQLSSTTFLAYSFTLTLVYFNSSLNPFLYCWKITEVRQAAKDTIRKLFCPSS